MTSNTTRINNLYPIPENMGISAISWATPTLNGFKIPAVKPEAAPIAIIAVPVTLSSPNEVARAIPIGTKIITSVDIPMVAPKMENSTRKAGITKNSLPLNAFDIFLHKTVSTPVEVMISKEPPMIRIKVTVLAALTIAR